MRAIIFTTGTPDTLKLIGSFQCLGHENEVHRYDVGAPNSPDIDFVGIVDRYRPDIVVYIGAIKGIHHSYVPSTDELCRANAIAPMVHLCSDSADPPWWPDLNDYNNRGAFRLQVGIDGQKDTPLAEYGMVALTPVDPSLFPDPPWSSRTVTCGFAGGVGFRHELLGALINNGVLQHYGSGTHSGAYPDLCRFYTTCYSVLNDARTGSGQRRHIKGRFVEAGLAGAVILEPMDSPAKDWFVPGEDFLEYPDPHHAMLLAKAIRDAPADYEGIGRRLRTKMHRDHSAPAFWAKVLTRMGLQ